MPLATVAVVQASPLLRVVLLAWAGACLLAAAAICASPRFHHPEAGAIACLLAALVATRAARPGKTTRRIDISGPGEIRLTVQHGMGITAPTATVVQLLPGSTLWPHCLLLLLRDADTGAHSTLTILPDSVPPDTFRNVSIALRAIARRDNKFFEKNKII